MPGTAVPRETSAREALATERYTLPLPLVGYSLLGFALSLKIEGKELLNVRLQLRIILDAHSHTKLGGFAAWAASSSKATAWEFSATLMKMRGGRLVKNRVE